MSLVGIWPTFSYTLPRPVNKQQHSVRDLGSQSECARMKEAKARHDNLQGSRTKLPCGACGQSPPGSGACKPVLCPSLAVALGSLLPCLPTSERLGPSLHVLCLPPPRAADRRLKTLTIEIWFLLLDRKLWRPPEEEVCKLHVTGWYKMLH